MEKVPSGLSRETFLSQYARFFGAKRISAIDSLGFLLLEGSAEGAFFFDTAGRRYLDLWCAGGNFSLGHRHPVVARAMREAVEREEFGCLFFFTEAKAELAQRLALYTPGRLECSFPTVTGGEAIDLAIKVARGATGRKEIIYADHAYHGCTGLALSMMARGDMRDFAEPLAPGFTEVRYGDAADLAAKISEKTAAVVLEPIRTDYDMAVPEPEYFTEVRRLCDRSGACLIVDEVVTGMGRLGTLWGCERWPVEPDMLVTAKGLCGGYYPMSAVVARPDLFDLFAQSPFRQISSFAWSNLGARVAAAALDETVRLLPSLEEKGSLLQALLEGAAARYPGLLRSTRRVGMMLGMDFRDEATGLRFASMMFAAGVFVVASSQNMRTIKLYPPLVIEREQIDLFADRFEDTLAKLA